MLIRRLCWRLCRRFLGEFRLHHHGRWFAGCDFGLRLVHARQASLTKRREPFEPALPVLRMNRAAARFTSSRTPRWVLGVFAVFSLHLVRSVSPSSIGSCW